MFIHEMAHAFIHSNDHLANTFYRTVTELGAKLVSLAVERTELFSERKGAAAA